MAAMTKTVIARRDDSIARIAEAEGHFPATIWDHPDNRALREARTSMNVLAEGDRIVVPPIVPKRVECETDARYRFRRRGVPARLRLQLQRHNDRRGERRAGHHRGVGLAPSEPGAPLAR